MEVDLKKAAIQKQAKEAWFAGGEWGALFMATRTGKSKVAIDIVRDLHVKGGQSEPRVLLVVPTEKLRDDNWRIEFDQWGAHKEYASLTRSCYASISKLEMQYFDLVIFDEGHRITGPNSRLFEKNVIKRVLLLSATPPDPKGNETDLAKILLFKQYRIKADFVYSLKQAVADHVVAPYEIKVVECYLDDTDKYITGGTKAKPFMQTELSRYQYLSKLIIKMQAAHKEGAAKNFMLMRMRLIQNSKAKTRVTKRIIERYAPGERTIVFCGSIAQAEELGSGYTFHSQTSDKMLNAFKALETDIIYVVEALNEGHTIAEVDQGIIAQLSASSRDLVQRVGRTLGKREDHIATIWIVVAKGTQDESWFKKAIVEFESEFITYIHASNI